MIFTSSSAENLDSTNLEVLEDSNQSFQAKIVLDEQVSRFILGALDRNRKFISKLNNVQVHNRGNNWMISGKKAEVSQTVELIKVLEGFYGTDTPITDELIFSIHDGITNHTFSAEQQPNLIDFNTVLTKPGGQVKPRTINQKRYIEAIDAHDLTLGVGPAGSGKTFLAVASAVKALKSGEVKRIILTRPAVEAGEKLGFLPGSLSEKIDPYLRPLFDSLTDLLTAETVASFLESGTIEIVPLAFMRGRTLNQAFIILDEAQNTTIEQMKMFLTRLGNKSKMVVTGDVTQIDLGKGITSGLTNVLEVLQDLEEVSIIRLNKSDIVRNPLVTLIVQAYEAKD